MDRLRPIAAVTLAFALRVAAFVVTKLAPVVARVRPLFRRPQVRRLQVAQGVVLLAGLALGLAWALPVEIRAECPPSGEGYGMCAVQKGYAPAAVLLVLPVFFSQVLFVFGSVTVPNWIRHWRAGERPTTMTRKQADPPYEQDPFLLAASWGQHTGREDRRRPRVTPTDSFDSAARRRAEGANRLRRERDTESVE